jgi:O-antigen ligase
MVTVLLALLVATLLAVVDARKRELRQMTQAPAPNAIRRAAGVKV